MREVNVQSDEVMLQFGWYAAQSAGQEHEVVHNMADEIVRLREALAAACSQGLPGSEAPATRVTITDAMLERAAMAAFTSDFDNEAMSWFDLSVTEEERYRMMARAVLIRTFAALEGPRDA